MKYHTLFYSKIGKDVSNFVVSCSRDWRIKDLNLFNIYATYQKVCINLISLFIDGSEYFLIFFTISPLQKLSITREYHNHTLRLTTAQ